MNLYFYFFYFKYSFYFNRSLNLSNIYQVVTEMHQNGNFEFVKEFRVMLKRSLVIKYIRWFFVNKQLTNISLFKILSIFDKCTKSSFKINLIHLMHLFGFVSFLIVCSKLIVIFSVSCDIAYFGKWSNEINWLIDWIPVINWCIGIIINLCIIYYSDFRVRIVYN